MRAREVPHLRGGIVVSAASRGGVERRVGEPPIPRVMGQVAEAAEAFESRWTLAPPSSASIPTCTGSSASSRTSITRH